MQDKQGLRKWIPLTIIDIHMGPLCLLIRPQVFTENLPEPSKAPRPPSGPYPGVSPRRDREIRHEQETHHDPGDMERKAPERRGEGFLEEAGFHWGCRVTPQHVKLGEVQELSARYTFSLCSLFSGAEVGSGLLPGLTPPGRQSGLLL